MTCSLYLVGFKPTTGPLGIKGVSLILFSTSPTTAKNPLTSVVPSTVTSFQSDIAPSGLFTGSGLAGGGVGSGVFTGSVVPKVDGVLLPSVVVVSPPVVVVVVVVGPLVVPPVVKVLEV